MLLGRSNEGHGPQQEALNVYRMVADRWTVRRRRQGRGTTRCRAMRWPTSSARTWLSGTGGARRLSARRRNGGWSLSAGGEVLGFGGRGGGFLSGVRGAGLLVRLRIENRRDGGLDHGVARHRRGALPRLARRHANAVAGAPGLQHDLLDPRPGGRRISIRGGSPARATAFRPSMALALSNHFREPTTIGAVATRSYAAWPIGLDADDLLHQASDLLQYQVDCYCRVPHARRWRRAAVNHLMDRRPDRVLANLRATRRDPISPTGSGSAVAAGGARAVSISGATMSRSKSSPTSKVVTRSARASTPRWLVHRRGGRRRRDPALRRRALEEWQPSNDVEPADSARRAPVTRSPAIRSASAAGTRSMREDGGDAGRAGLLNPCRRRSAQVAPSSANSPVPPPQPIRSTASSATRMRATRSPADRSTGAVCRAGRERGAAFPVAHRPSLRDGGCTAAARAAAKTGAEPTSANIARADRRGSTRLRQ